MLLNMTSVVRSVDKFVKNLVVKDMAHGYTHVRRVRNWAVQIAKSENYKDLQLVEIVSLLHDIGFSRTNNWELHAKIGADMAKNFLTTNAILTKNKVKLIEEVIERHSSREKTHNKLLIILRDADMLDMLGALGIIRTFISQHDRKFYDEKNPKGDLWKSSYKAAYEMYNPNKGAGLCVVDQLNFQKHCLKEIQTTYAKNKADAMCKFMDNFILELEAEVQNH